MNSSPAKTHVTWCLKSCPAVSDVSLNDMADERKLQFFLLFPRKKNDSVLVCERGPADHYQLPCLLWDEDEETPMANHAALAKRIEKELLLSRTQYFLLYNEFLIAEYNSACDEYRQVKGLLVFENLNIPEDAPEGYVWIPRKMLQKFPLRELPEQNWEPGEREVKRLGSLPTLVGRFFTHVSDAARDTPWENTGWYGTASSWICSRLRDTEFNSVNYPVSVCSGPASLVMSVDTASGRKAYFKAQRTWEVWRFLPSEALITNYLSRIFPNSFIPRVLAIDPQREWMLTEQFGKDLEDGEAHVSDYTSIFQTLYKFQRECINRIEELYAASCRYKGLKFVYSNLLEALRDPEARSLVETETIMALEGRMPFIQQIFRFMEELKLPDTLSHGDLWWPNIAFPRAPGGSFTFFDWECAAVSHPFFDAHWVLDWSKLNSLSRKEVKLMYLRHWEGYASLGELQKAWDLIPVVRAMRYVAEFYLSKKAQRNFLLKTFMHVLLRKLEGEQGKFP